MTANNVISKAQSYVGYDWHHFLEAFGIGCTAWCAAFVSVVGREAGGQDLIPWSISCNAQISWWKDHGCWLGTNPSEVRPGDYIYYDWDHIDEPLPADHVGIIEKVNGNTFTVIEGNFGNAENYQTRVSRRTVTKGWGCIFGYARPKYDGASATTEITENDTPELSQGDENAAVKTLQRLLIEKGYDLGYCGADGEFGPVTAEAVKKFQASVGLTADGIVGPLTWSKLKATKTAETTTASTSTEEKELAVEFKTKQIGPGSTGDVVRKLQTWLSYAGYECEVDGDFGNETKTAAIKFQTKVGLTADGIVGPLTWSKLINS